MHQTQHHASCSQCFHAPYISPPELFVPHMLPVRYVDWHGPPMARSSRVEVHRASPGADDALVWCPGLVAALMLPGAAPEPLAGPGNDNMLYIWDVTHRVPRISLDAHSAAVKALAWCPFARNVLASGGGTADRTLRLWDANTGTLTNSVDTRSQARGHTAAGAGCRV